MQIDVNLRPSSISDYSDLATTAERMGFDGVWVTETVHSPYVSSSLATAETNQIDVGIGIAVAFPRSPMVTAYTAWDLQSLSGGRFVLGLGTQVKGHIQCRFDSTWESPGPQLREYVEVLRHIWNAWANDDPVDYHGDWYDIDLCPPDWRPDPIENPQVPIYVAGVNDFNVKLAGHLCDGLHIHPLNSPVYVEERVLPALETGLEIGDRRREDVTLAASVFAITGETPADREAARKAVREQIGFYGSTRTYESIFEVHGWGDVCDELHSLSVSGDWDQMPELVTDEMLETFAVEAPWSELRDAIEQRYSHVDRVALYMPFDGTDAWTELA